MPRAAHSSPLSNLEVQILRIVRNLLLIVLAVLALPYLLAPLYSVGRPVSTLMAWRWLTGAPVVRQWVDLGAMSPALPLSVVGAEDAKFCSHHGIDWDALRDVLDDAEDGEVSRGGSTTLRGSAGDIAPRSTHCRDTGAPFSQRQAIRVETG